MTRNNDLEIQVAELFESKSIQKIKLSSYNRLLNTMNLFSSIVATLNLTYPKRKTSIFNKNTKMNRMIEVNSKGITYLFKSDKVLPSQPVSSVNSKCNLFLLKENVYA